MTTLVTLEVQSPGGNDSVSLVHARYCNYSLNFSQGGPVPLSDLASQTESTKKPVPKIPALDMTTLVTLEVHSPGDNDSVLHVPVRCRFSFRLFTKTLKINLQISGTKTGGEFKSVFNNISLNLTHEYMRFDFRFCGSSAKLVYTSQNIAADKVDRIIIISLINCMNRNTQAHTRMD